MIYMEKADEKKQTTSDGYKLTKKFYSQWLHKYPDLYTSAYFTALYNSF